MVDLGTKLNIVKHQSLFVKFVCFFFHIGSKSITVTTNTECERCCPSKQFEGIKNVSKTYREID